MANRHVPNPLTDEQQEFIKTNAAKYTVRQLATRLQIDYYRVFRYVNENKIEVKKPIKKVKVETEFFDYDRNYF